MAVAAAVAVIVLSSAAAMAVTFNVAVTVGWSTGGAHCVPDTDCLGFGVAGPFGPLVLTWDENGNPTCEDAGGGLVNGLTREAEINDRFVHITLQQLPTPVPTPASLLLVGLSLVGAGVLPLLRRRRAA
jgi:hypothetical protein